MQQSKSGGQAVARSRIWKLRTFLARLSDTLSLGGGEIREVGRSWVRKRREDEEEMGGGLI